MAQDPTGHRSSSRLAILFLSVLVDMVGFGIVLPLLPFYAEEFGATPLQVTLLIASFAAMQFMAVPVWGRLSDRLGRRPFIVASLFASAVSYLIFGLAQSLAVLFISRIAAGAAGGTISVAQAYVADSTAPDRRAHGLSLLGAASGLGILFGPAIGGYFSGFGYHVPGFIAAGLCAANGVAALFFLPESRQRGAAPVVGAGVSQAATLGSWLRTLSSYPFSLLLPVYFLCIMSFTAMTAVLALYGDRAFGMTAMDMGILFALAGGTTAIVRGLLVGWLVRQAGELRIVQVGTVALALTLFVIPLIQDPALMYVLVPFWALAAGLTFPSLVTLVSLETDVDSQGSILSGQQVVGGVGRVLGPIWAGALFGAIHINTPFFVGAALVLIAAIMSLWLRQPSISRPPRVRTPPPDDVAA